MATQFVRYLRNKKDDGKTDDVVKLFRKLVLDQDHQAHSGICMLLFRQLVLPG
jgi:hypothetical protein